MAGGARSSSYGSPVSPQHGKGKDAQSPMLFIDHRLCRKKENAKRFVKKHNFIRMILLTERTPRLNLTEWLGNWPVKPVVCSNRSHGNIDEADEWTTYILRPYRSYGLEELDSAKSKKV